MSDEKKNLTVFQKLTRVIGKGVKQPDAKEQEHVYNLNRSELLRTTDRTEFDTKKLQLQQSTYLLDKWQVIDKQLYDKQLMYETTRIASYMDAEGMEFCLAGETKIPTPNGFITIKELADMGREHEFFVYAYDHKHKKVVPAKARNARHTKDEMTFKVIFDDGSYLIGTKEHRVMKRDGSYVMISDLKTGDSMMPFYRKSFYKNFNYNWVYSCNSAEGYNGWVSEHNMVAEWYGKKLLPTEVVHHKNFDGKNNLPENLEIMDKTEHLQYHAKINNEKLWSNPFYREKMIRILKENNQKGYKWNGKRAGKNNPAYFDLPISKILEVAKEHKTICDVATILDVSIPKIQREIKKIGFNLWNDFLIDNNITPKPIDSNGKNNPRYFNLPLEQIIDSARTNYSLNKTAKFLGVSTPKIRREIRFAGFNGWEDLLNKNNISKTSITNHKVVEIIPHEVIPVYDITVPGLENFATDTIFVHNCPEISVSLDILAEESTTSSEKGEILSIFSESKRVKQELTHLFENVLDINTNLVMWARNACKFGDNFVYLKVDEDKGIIGCYQLPTIEMERLEGEAYKNYMAHKSGNQQVGIQNKEDLSGNQVKFRWKDKNIDFQPWEIAHFRLLGDDRKLPYGTSMLEKARRYWKQLIMAEDAMLNYRISRAPERRVFKVFVGNMDDNDVESYVQRVANKFKRDQISNPANGQVDTRFNTMSNDQDYFVPVRDPSASSPIETLPGASNLGEIQDIEYIQKKLVTAMRVPKAFLGFEEVVGDGKGLSMMDIRFARTINRIQKSLVQELNKIAVVHLYMLGLEDELTNFTLGLTNPSTQSELLKIEQWKEKILLYKDAVGDGQSIAPTSHTFAKKFFLGMSDAEVKLDLQQQKVERGIAEELNNSKDMKTGIFNTIDKLYKTGEAPAAEGEEGAEGAGGGGGTFSSSSDMGAGFETADTGTEEGGEGTDVGGDVAAPPETAGDTAAPPADTAPEVAPEEEQLSESIVLGNGKTEGYVVDFNKGRERLDEIKNRLNKLLGD